MRKSSGNSVILTATLSLVLRYQPAMADELILRNGDHITGKILSLARGNLTLTSEVAGKLRVDVKNVQTFSSDEPLAISLGEGGTFRARVERGPAGSVLVRRSPDAAPEFVSILDIVSINPPTPGWTGEISMNGTMTGSETRTLSAGTELTLDADWTRNRVHFAGEYMYGREHNRESGLTTTTDDFGSAYGKYAHDIRDKAYAHINAKVLHDALAELQYRASPAAGIGYRWLDTPRWDVFTDLGVAYNNERFSTFGGRSFWGPQVEYGVTWKPTSRLRLANTLEYYPSFSELSENYLVDTQAEIHLTVWKRAFIELRAEYHRDTKPAPGITNNQYRFVLGPGWEF